MRRLVFTFFIVLFLMMHANSVHALFSEKQDWVASVVEHTEQCITDCKTTYQMCNPNWFSDVDLASAVTVAFRDDAQNVRGYAYEFQIRKEEAYQIPVYQLGTSRTGVVRGRLANQTEDVSYSYTPTRTLIGFRTETRTTYTSITTYTLRTGECVNLTVRGLGKLQPHKHVDNILSVHTGWQDFEYDEWAWWNNGWSLQQNLTSTKPSSWVSTLSFVPICVNNCSFNHAALVAAGKSNLDGRDLRVINESGAYEWAYQFEGQLNQTNTTIWFSTNFTAGSTNNTDTVYYGNITNAVSTANPKVMWDNLGATARFDFSNATGANLTSSNQEKICSVEGASNPRVDSHPRYGIQFQRGVGGSNDFFNCGDDDNLFTNVQGTYIIVFRPYTNGTVASPLSLFSKENIGNNDGPKLGINYGFGAFSNNKITWAWSQETAANLAIDNDTLIKNMTYTVMAVYDNLGGGTTNISLFVNGVLKNSTEADDMAGPNDNDFAIGGSCASAGPDCSGPAREFDGEISEMIIFNRTIPIDWYKQWDYCVRFGCGLLSGPEGQLVSTVELTSPVLTGLGIVPNVTVGNTSLTGIGISAFANFTEYRGKNGTVYFTWAKNDVRNYSMVSAVPANSGYFNVSTILNYTLKLNRGDSLMIVVNATNGSDYSAYTNVSIVVGNFVPTIPALSLRLPTNDSYFYNTANVTLTCNGSVEIDTNDASSPQYEFMASEFLNIPVTQNLNASLATTFYFDNLNSSKYYWTCRAFDPTGAYSAFAQNLTFTVNNTFLANRSVIFTKDVTEQTTQNVEWVFVFVNQSVASANLTFRFNNTLYGTSSTTYPQNNTVRFFGSYTAPSVESTNVTKQLEWNLTLFLTNGSSNTTLFNASVNVIQTGFGICNATNPFTTLNISVRFETNFSFAYNNSQDSTWVIYPVSSASNRRVSFNRTAGTGIGMYDYCLTDSDLIVYTDAIFVTSKAGYANREYWLNRFPLTNNISFLEVYLLENSRATVNIIKVQNEYAQGIVGALVAVQKYDAGTDSYKTLQQVKTDNNGQAVVALEWYSSLYRFVVTINGEIRLVSLLQKIAQTDIPLTINPSFFLTHDKFAHIGTNLVFDNVTRVFTLTYQQPSPVLTSVCLKVDKWTLAPTINSTVCDVCSNQTLNTLTCNITRFGDGSYMATAYGLGSFNTYQSLYEIVFGHPAPFDTREGLAVSFFIVLGAGIMGLLIGGGIYMLLFTAISLGFTMAFSLTVLSGTAFAGLLLAFAYIIWKGKY